MTRRARVRLASIIVALATIGCAATDMVGGGSSATVLGTWTYAASSVSPASSVSATMSATAHGVSSFVGDFDGDEIDSRGVRTHLVGAVSGDVAADGSIAFDVISTTETRHHMAELRGDTLVGTWLVTDGGGVSASGNFKAVRQ